MLVSNVAGKGVTSKFLEIVGEGEKFQSRGCIS